MSEVIELAERALALAEGEVQVSVQHERSLVSRFARSMPTQATDVEDVGVEVLSVVEGYTASASTNALDDEALRAVAVRAREAATAAARLGSGRGDYPGLPAPGAPSPHDGHDPETARLDPSVAGAALAAAFAQAAAHDTEAFGIWTAGEVRMAITSSAGVHLQDALTDAHMKVICRDAQGRSGYAARTSTSSGELDGDELARSAAAKVDPREPAELPAGEYPVVLEAEAVGSLLEFLGLLAFNGLTHAEGRGALAGRLGTRVAAPAISLSDSPRFAGTLPRAFDAEGVPKLPLALIRDGVAQRVVHDTRSAARAGHGARSTGHALAPGGSPFGPLPTNLVLAGGGAADEHELAAPIERGLYVTRLWYVNAVREKEALLTGMTRDGTFLIEDGRITRPVRDVRFTDSALRILAETEALGARPRLVSDAELYGPRFLYGSVCPPLRARGFRITGGTVA